MFTGLRGAASIRVGARTSAASASAAVAIRISGRKMRMIDLKANSREMVGRDQRGSTPRPGRGRSLVTLSRSCMRPMDRPNHATGRSPECDGKACLDAGRVSVARADSGRDEVLELLFQLLPDAVDFADEGVVEVRQPGLGLDKDEALDEIAHEGRVAALGDVAHQLDGDLIGGDAGVNGLPAGEVGDDIFGDGGLEGLEP